MIVKECGHILKRRELGCLTGMPRVKWECFSCLSCAMPLSEEVLGPESLLAQEWEKRRA